MEPRAAAPFLTGVLTTAGGVGFVGDLDRTFRAFDVKTGETLWQTRLGTSVQGYPVTFSAGGRQYIAVTTGAIGGGSPRVVPRTIIPDVQDAGDRQRALCVRVAREEIGGTDSEGRIAG